MRYDERMHLSARRRGQLALLVTILALTQIVGAALMSRPLLHAGMALGFAPLPRPFGAVQGYENFAVRHAATLIYADGRSEMIDLHALVPHLSGPHRAKIAVTQGFIYMPTYSYAFTAPLLARILCVRVPEMRGNERPIRATVRIESDTAGWEAYVYERTISCART